MQLHCFPMREMYFLVILRLDRIWKSARLDTNLYAQRRAVCDGLVCYLTYRTVAAAFSLFPRATSQVAMPAWIFGDCREGQITRCLQHCKIDIPLLAAE